MENRSAEVLAPFSPEKSTKAVSSPRLSPQTKSPRKKHSPSVNKWSKQNGRDEFSSNEDLATCSGGKHIFL